MPHDPLLEPFTLNRTTLRNRIVSTSHEPSYSEGGLLKDRYRAYHVAKAEGGCGLSMLGTAMVAPDSPSSFGKNLAVHHPETLRWFEKLAAELHERDTAVICQISHIGRRTGPYSADWLPVVSPSSLPETFHRSMPKAAEEWDIERHVADYAAAARRCAEAGLDGVEIESYGHLFDAYLSPLTNHRDDAWGGDAGRRLRFPLAVVRAVREAVGPDCVFGVRMSLDEATPGGLDLEHGLAALDAFVDAGIDYVSVVRGTIGSDAGLARMIPPMGTPSAPFLDFVGSVRDRIRVPVMHAARINDVATARYAVSAGLVDLIGMTRAQMADPELVNKLARGEADRIRPCVGATFCLDALHTTGDSKCIHNAATGRELSIPHRAAPLAPVRRTAVVVGAGPAGLEAARILGERGHRVVLLEAADRAGGQLLLASATARRRDLIGIVDWRLAELKHHDVELRLGVLADRETVLSEAPDVVVIATGGLPAPSRLATGGDLVLDVWDVLSGADLHGSALVYDFVGDHPGLAAVETLATRGLQVEYVFQGRTVAPEVGPLTMPGYLRMFAEHGVTTTLNQYLTAVRRGPGGLVATLWNEYAGTKQERVVDHVVVEGGTVANDELYHALVPGSVNRGEVDHAALVAYRPQGVVRDAAGTYQLFRIGDAVTGRNVHAAIYDAVRLGLAV